MSSNITTNNSINFSTEVAPVSIYSIMATWLARIYYIMSVSYGMFFFVFGFSANLLIILVMIGGKESFKKGTSKTARLYYIAFAFSDIGCLFSTPITNFTGDGLYYVTNGTFFFYVDLITNDWCHFWRVLFHFSDGFLFWSINLFNMERLIALQWPFFARRFITTKRVAVVLFVFCVLSLLLSLLAIIAYQAQPSKASAYGYICMAVSPTYSAIGIILSFGLGFGSIGIPIILILILMLLLVFKVNRRQKEHAEFSNSTSGGHSASSNSSELLSITVTVSAVSFIFNFPFAITWVALSAFGPLMSTEIISILQPLRRFLITAAQPMHCMNFLIYLYFMRSFRGELTRMLGCTFIRSTVTSSTKTSVTT